MKDLSERWGHKPELLKSHKQSQQLDKECTTGRSLAPLGTVLAGFWMAHHFRGPDLEKINLGASEML
jgi:hypothetical protein